MRFLPLAFLLLASCATPRGTEPSDEQRLESSLSEARGNIPPALPFNLESAPVGSPFFAGDELVNDGMTRPHRWGARHHGFGIVQRTPARSQALSQPQGVPGGSRPGLLP